MKLLPVTLLALFLLGCKEEPRMMSQLNFYEVPGCEPIIGKDGQVIAAPPGEIIVVEGCIRPVSELLAERDSLLKELEAKMYSSGVGLKFDQKSGCIVELMYKGKSFFPAEACDLKIAIHLDGPHADSVSYESGDDYCCMPLHFHHIKWDQKKCKYNHKLRRI